MPNLTAIKTPSGFNDMALSKTGALSSGFSAIRDAASASSAINNQTYMNVSHGIIGFGLSTGYLARAAIAFDFSGNDDSGDSISGNTVASANLVVRSMENLGGFATVTANTGNSIYVCKCNDSGTSFDSQTYSALDGYVSSGSYDGEVTVYGTANEAADATITFNLNSTCISDINSEIGSGGKLLILLLCQDDFLYNTSSGGLGSAAGTGFFGKYEGVRLRTTEYTTDTTHQPRLELTYGAAAAATDNATFFGINF